MTASDRDPSANEHTAEQERAAEYDYHAVDIGPDPSAAERTIDITTLGRTQRHPASHRGLVPPRRRSLLPDGHASTAQLVDPRLSMMGMFLSLSRVLSDRCRLEDEVAAYAAIERTLGQMLDYGLIGPRLHQLSERSATELDEPRLLDCIRDGSPTHAWSFADRQVWHPARLSPAIRAIQRFLPTGPPSGR